MILLKQTCISERLPDFVSVLGSCDRNLIPDAVSSIGCVARRRKRRAGERWEEQGRPEKQEMVSIAEMEQRERDGMREHMGKSCDVEEIKEKQKEE